MKRTDAEHRRPGYYPGYETMSQQSHWDDATRKTVQERMAHSLELHFFTPEEAPLIENIFEHLLPQSDRPEGRKVPIVAVVDERLHTGRIGGYRYERMPPDPDAYRLGMKGIEQTAIEAHGRGYLDLTWLEQDKLLQSLHDARPKGGQDIWEQMPVHRFWMLMVQDAAEAYYAHPYAWDEVGFGGPAYPRAYMRLSRGEPEPWEVEEVRYEWQAPGDTVSDIYEPVGGEESHHASPGQGGTN